MYKIKYILPVFIMIICFFIFPQKVYANTINIVVIGDSISEYGNSDEDKMTFHGSIIGMSNSGWQYNSSSFSSNKMWYNLMISWLNSENTQGNTYQLKCVDALGGSMVYDTGDTSEELHRWAHKGTSACMASNLTADLNVNYYGKSRLDCLCANMNNHPKAVNMILVEAGTNDILNNVSASDFRNAYSNMLDRLHSKYPNALIVCIPPANLTTIRLNDSLGNVVTTDVSQASANIRNGFEQAVYDNNKSYLSCIKVVPTQNIDSFWGGTNVYENDSVHLNENGQFYLGQNVKNVIKDINISTANIDIHEPGDNYIIDSNSTCTSNGSKSKHCKYCNQIIESTVQTIPASGHSMNSSITKQPSCSQKGIRTYSCSKCSYSYTEDIDKLSHTPGNAVIENNINATCTSNGSYDTVVYCSKCNTQISRVNTTTKKLGHNYQSSITTPATCKSDGVRTFTCSRCQDNYNEKIDKNSIPHTEGPEKQINIVPSTCENSGSYTSVKTCNVCGITLSTSEKVTKPLGHQWVHDSNYDKSPTCTENGYTYYKCNICNKEDFSHSIPAFNHEWDEGHIIKEPTLISTGTREYICKRDSSHTYQEEIPTLNEKDVFF